MRYCKSEKGFALVVALVLMSFILLLLVSLSTLVTADLKVASVHMLQTQARKNALFGLQVAMGELQKSMGPDQRVSAQADILTLTDDPAAGARRWTGVWNSDATHPDYTEGERIAWLVSGDVNPDTGHTVGAGADAVTLVGKALDVADPNNPDRVTAPLVEISSTSGSPYGHYAWWVGDEGTRVRYHTGSTPDANPNHAFTAPDNSGLSALPDFGGYDANDTMNPHVSDLSHLEIVYPGTIGAGQTAAERAQLLHTVSFASKGLATNTRDGGLRQDLTVLFEGNQALPDWGTNLPDLELARSFYQLKDEVNNSGAAASIAPRAQTDTEHGVVPVMTYFMFHFGYVASSHSYPADLYVTLKPTIVLANPYNIKLESADYEVVWSPEPGKQASGFIIRIYGTNSSAYLSMPTREMNDVLGDSLTFKISDQSFEPGEVKVFTIDSMSPEPFPSTGLDMINDGVTPLSAYAWINTNVALDPGFFGPDGTGLAAEGTMQMLYGFNRFTLKVNGSEAQTLADVFVPSTWVETDPADSSFDPASLEHMGGVHADSAYFGVPVPIIARNSRHDRVSYGTSRYGGTVNVNTGMSWLVSANLRATNPALPDSSDYLWDGSPAHLGVYVSGGVSNVGHYVVDTDGEHAFWGYGTSPATGFSNVVLFDVPRGPILSIGQLQHLNIGSIHDPAYSLGNSWASVYYDRDEADFSYRINEATWDRFFFSGYDAASHDWLNPRIQPTDSALSADNALLDDPDIIAALLTIEGAFNVNSTSIEAWEAQLASLRRRAISYFDAADTANGIQTYDAGTLANPVARAPLPTGTAFVADHPSDGISAEMWKGFRNLTDDEISRLAAQIVYQVKLRGPFLSISDFVNRDLSDESDASYGPWQMGALQAALDYRWSRNFDGGTYPATGINSNLREWIGSTYIIGATKGIHQRVTSATETGLPHPEATDGQSRSRAAPGYVTQADLLSILGSVVSARSDTFTIRAYGDVENELNGESAYAVCEAIVQRITEPVYPDDTNPWEPTAATKQTLGRKFVITSFRWLDEDEI